MAATAKQFDWTKPVRMSEAEYLAFEEQAEEKHEFYDGIVRPLSLLIMMAGGAYEHSLIISNALRSIGNRLDGTGCRALDSNIRVKARHLTRYSYPDVTLLCGEPEFDEQAGGRTTLNNPTAVIEILSPGTQKFDRSEKFDRYQQIASLREYVLIETTKPFVQVLWRDDAGNWIFQSWSDINDIITFHSVGIEVPLTGVYRDMTFPDPANDENYIIKKVWEDTE